MYFVIILRNKIKIGRPSIIQSPDEQCNLIFNDSIMKIGQSKVNITFEYKLKTILYDNDTTIDYLFDNIRTPRILT